jgi:hypothetical protein
MKSITVLNKAYLMVLLLSVSACNELTPVPKASLNEGGVIGGGDNSPILVAPSRVLRVKNYNQYNMTLEKLTGISRGTHNELFNSLKGSMPADNEIEAMTPFNLVAMTRLADAYCRSYLYDLVKFPNTMFSTFNEEAMIDHLVESFLDNSSDQDYSTLRVELRNIFANSDGLGGVLFPNPDSNRATANRNYSVAACTAVLASPYITLLE